jgi:hypothetical protein
MEVEMGMHVGAEEDGIFWARLVHYGGLSTQTFIV